MWAGLALAALLAMVTPGVQGGALQRLPQIRGEGDPVMTAFDGQQFRFVGAIGSSYNVLSEKDHQLSMKLKDGITWNHDGTYMTALGFRYKEHSVVVSEEGDDDVAVLVDGEALALLEGATGVEHVVAGGKLAVSRALRWADHGKTVEVTTDLLKLLIWVVPAGTRDEGGIAQPAYLNFELTMLGAPEGEAMQGLLGETYGREPVRGFDEGRPARAPRVARFEGVEADYEVVSLFDAASPKSLRGKTAGAASARRLLRLGQAV